MKSETPLITVVIPCYNHEKFIEKAVLSVFNQTYPSVELVVVDDGSTDGSVNKLKKLQTQHTFKLFCQTNQGVCSALNNAIRQGSEGELIALLGSDDIWHHEKLKLQVEKIKENPDSEFVFCFSKAIEFTDENNLETNKIFPKKCRTGKMLNDVVYRQHVPAGTIIFSRKLYDNIGGFDENLKEEDWDFVLRSAAKTNFVAVQKPLLYYRSHFKNTMKTRKRSEIFQDKAKLLSKNFHLVSSWRWMISITIHFVRDVVFGKISTL